MTDLAAMRAKGVAKFAVTPPDERCVVSTVVYAVRGGFETDILLPTVLGVLAGGIAGAALLKKLSAPVLNLLFYGLMLFAGIKMMV